MTTEKLIVKNFGPIREAELDLRKVTVLIGEQASGKSVLAKLVAICGDRFAPQELTQKDFSNYQLQTFFRENSFIQYNEKTYSIDFQKGSFFTDFKEQKVGELIFKLAAANEQLLKLDFKPGGEKDVEQIEKIDNKIEYWEKTVSNLVEDLNEILYESCYVPAERISIFSISNLGFQSVGLQPNNDIFKALYKFRRKYISYKGILKSVSLLPLNMTLQSDGASDVIQQNGFSIPFSDTSSGIQSITPLIVVVEGSLLNDKKYLFIIEEPELNLYPTTQKKLVEYLIEKCTQGDNRLIITTHSPYILTALNNCIQAHNVAKLHPENAEEVNKLVPPQYQIAYEDVSAYYVRGGTAKSIMNDEFQMIDANALDDVSTELSEVFDKLIDLKYQKQD